MVKKWADKADKNYFWDDGLLNLRVIDALDNAKERLVLSRTVRERVLRLAHNDTGHMGHKKYEQSLAPGPVLIEMLWISVADARGARERREPNPLRPLYNKSQ